MAISTTEDQELVEKEPVPFYGHYYLTDPPNSDDQTLLNPVLRKIKVEYRPDDSSEDLAN